MLALYITYRIHDKGMKSASAKGAYCDVAVLHNWTAHFPGMSLNDSKDLVDVKVQSVLAEHRSLH